MLVLPIDYELGLGLVIVTLIVEFLRIFISYLIARPNPKLKELTIEKYIVSQEIAEIKSVQLQLVQHGKLNRRLIKIDKEIEKMQENDGPKAKLIKKYAKIIRLIIYGALIACCYNINRVLVAESTIFWPLSPSSPTIDIFPFHIICLSAFSWRHLFRIFLPIFNRKVIIP